MTALRLSEWTKESQKYECPIASIHEYLEDFKRTSLDNAIWKTFAFAGKKKEDCCDSEARVVTVLIRV